MLNGGRITWQICPRVLLKMIQDKDTARADRAMTAMMQMRKLDIAKLTAAYEGK